MDETSSRAVEARSAQRQTDETELSGSGPGLEALTAASAQAGEGRKPGHESGRRTLENAGYLLHYAVEAGIEVEPEVAQRIIDARRLGDQV